MQETLICPPRTMMEVFHSLPEGTWVEVIDGVMSMLPSFSAQHQRVVAKLLMKIDDSCKEHNLGEVMPIIDVYLDEHSNVVLPDITFTSNANSHIVKDHIYGTPDLIIEVLIKENENHDLITKKDLYEKFGVKEYWIVDPANKSTIGYTLVEKKLSKN